MNVLSAPKVFTSTRNDSVSDTLYRQLIEIQDYNISHLIRDVVSSNVQERERLI